MEDDPIASRLGAALADLDTLRGPVSSGAPWPLAERWDDTPEAHWGPPEVLAHLAEMFDFWDGELGRIAASDGSAPVPFGRITSDPSRLARIDAARRRPMSELFDEIATLGAAFGNHWRSWSAVQRARVGLHPIRGEVSVEAGAGRFIVGHLEDHVVQLRSTLGGDAPAA